MSGLSEKQYTLEEVEDKFIQEIGRRMDEDAKEFPAHVMATFLKIRERREEVAQAEEAKPFKLLDELPTLPTPRALQLAMERITELENEMRELEVFVASKKPEATEVPVREVR